MKIEFSNVLKTRIKQSINSVAFVFATLMLSGFSFSASANASSFVVDAKTGCKIYNYVESRHSASWSGACVDEKISGNGVLVIVYKKENGSCTFKTEAKDGLMNGFAQGTCTDGSTEEGRYVDGDLNGQGFRVGPDGDRWEGENKNGWLNGQGTHTLAKLPKYKYQGTFVNNKYNGQGVQTFPDGEKRVGEFKGGVIIQGAATYPIERTKYEGQFKNEMPDGKGKLTFEFGTTYEGEFKEGKYHGNGRLMYVYGDYQIGLFEQGKFISGSEKDSGSLADRQMAEAERNHEFRMQVNAQADFNSKQYWQYWNSTKPGGYGSK